MIFFCLFSSSPVVIVALLGLRGGHGEVGRVGRHGELFLDAGDGGGTSDSAGFCFVYLEKYSRTALRCRLWNGLGDLDEGRQGETKDLVAAIFVIIIRCGTP